jgi:hypothetical protein
VLASEFQKTYLSFSQPPVEAHVLEWADDVERSFEPMFVGHQIKEATFARTKELEYALFAIGSSVLGAVTTPGGLVAVEARIQDVDVLDTTRLAFCNRHAVPDYGYLTEKLGVVITALAHEEYLAREASRMHPITSVYPRFWAENCLHIRSRIDETSSKSDTLTVRLDIQKPIALFALSAAKAVLFHDQHQIMPSQIDLSEAVKMPSGLLRLL